LQPEEQEQFSPELISVGAKALVDEAKRLGLTWTLRLATVVTVSSDNSVTAVFDGDTVPIGMTSMSFGPLVPDQRVYVVIVPPSGNFIVGTPTTSSLVDLIFPIGYVYMSAVDVSPATFLGGTWLAMQNSFLVGAGGLYSALATGGTINHTHTQGNTGNEAAHTHTQGNTGGGSSHSHGINQGTDQTSQVTGPAVFTVSHQTHNHGGSTNNESSHTHTNPTTSAGSTHAHTNPTTNAQDNLPPYIAVFMWRRTA
jgi:hypothetical protein